MIAEAEVRRQMAVHQATNRAFDNWKGDFERLIYPLSPDPTKPWPRHIFEAIETLSNYARKRLEVKAEVEVNTRLTQWLAGAAQW